MKCVVLIILLSALVGSLSAQNQVVNQITEDLLESVGENLNDDVDFQEILDDWEDLRQNPLKVNLASATDFQHLHLLSELQIENLIAYRRKTGTIYSLYELVAVDGFTPDILQKMEPFISFEVLDELTGKQRTSTNVLVRSTRSFQSAEDASHDKYEGSPGRYYLRMKHGSSRINYGLVAEKDPGEAFFSQSNKQGFDYLGVYGNAGFGGNNNRLFLGDYHVCFGQGLVAWQGFSMGKSAETTQIYCPTQGIRSYSSTDENQFCRGIAAQINFRSFTFCPFVSKHKIDASIDTVNGAAMFGAFQTGGYHRTASEIAGEKSLQQFVSGGHISYSYHSWTFGTTAVYTRYNAFMDRSNEPYNQFMPEGKEYLVAGVDWKGSVGKVFFFGEGAVSKNSGRALLAGMTMNPASNAELSLLYRNISKTYYSFFANAFTESSRVNDENGMYLGLKFFPVSKWIVQLYADFFRFRWIKYATAAPSCGNEFFAQVSYTPSRKTNYCLRLFQEEKEQRIIDGLSKYNGQQLINRVRLNFSHDLNERVSLKSRIELSFFSKQSKEKGLLIYQDLAFKPDKKSYSVNGRLAYFSTEGYNSRLYACENDLLYSFSVPALFGHGIRAYLNLQKKFGDKLTLWIKLADTHQFEYSGPEVASENNLEVKIQLRCQF